MAPDQIAVRLNAVKRYLCAVFRLHIPALRETCFAGAICPSAPPQTPAIDQYYSPEGYIRPRTFILYQGRLELICSCSAQPSLFGSERYWQPLGWAAYTLPLFDKSLEATVKGLTAAKRATARGNGQPPQRSQLLPCLSLPIPELVCCCSSKTLIDVESIELNSTHGTHSYTASRLPHGPRYGTAGVHQPASAVTASDGRLGVPSVSSFRH